MEVCANCGHGTGGRYCANCGQVAEVPRFTWQYVLQELPAGLIAWDKGFLYTAKELFTRPGHSIREYMEGKRVRHFRPLPMLAFCAGIMGVLGYLLEAPILSVEVDGSREVMAAAMGWFNDHYMFIELALLPFVSIATWSYFRNDGYNLVEHVVINAFLGAQRLILNIALMPLVLVFPNESFIMVQSGAVTLISFVLFNWSLTQLFRTLSVQRVVLRSFMAYGLAFVMVGALAAIIVFVMVRSGYLHLK